MSESQIQTDSRFGMSSESRFRSVVLELVVVALVFAGCGTEGGGGEVLRVVATVEYPSADSTLVFRPGDLELESQTWAHIVDFEIAADDWIQHVSLYDSYAVEGSQLIPAQGASVEDHALSDEGPFGGTFSVELGALNEGAHRVSLSVPVSLEPQPRHENILEPKELTLAIEFVYHVWTEPAGSGPNYPTVEEVQASDVEDAQDLNALLGCSTAVMTFHHESVTDASEALTLATRYVRDMPEMQGHEDIVDTVPVGTTDQGVEELWAIVDIRGQVIGSVERGQAIFMCENRPPYSD